MVEWVPSGNIKGPGPAVYEQAEEPGSAVRGDFWIDLDEEANATAILADGAVVSMDNPLPVVQHRAPDAILTAHDPSTSAAEILGVNDHRHGVLLHNASTATVYIRCGGAAELDFFSFPLKAGRTYEPSQPTAYVGTYSAIWADGAATGQLLVTEFE